MPEHGKAVLQSVDSYVQLAGCLEVSGQAMMGIQRLEHWLATGPQHIGHMAKPVFLLGTRIKMIEPVGGCVRWK